MLSGGQTVIRTANNNQWISRSIKQVIKCHFVSKTQIYPIYNLVKQEKAENCHIWEAATIKYLVFLPEKWLKRWTDHRINDIDCNWPADTDADYVR